MAYCVHCGVELAASEPKCPLCDTPVLNPAQPWQEPAERPYPTWLDTAHRINRKYGARLIAALMLVPMTAALACDLYISGRISWSPYVLGAFVCLFFWGVFPLLLDGARPYLCVLIDTAVSALYLALIGQLSGGMRWYYEIALPITIILGVAVAISVYVFRRHHDRVLDKLSCVVFLCAIAIICIEALVDYYVFSAVSLKWSIYAMIPLAALGVTMRILERNKRLKEIIHKRLYI